MILILYGSLAWVYCFQPPSAQAQTSPATLPDLQLSLQGAVYAIIGVLRRGFVGVQPGSPSDFYVPMAAGSPFLYAPIMEDWHWFVHLMARIKPAVSDAQFRAALDVAFAREAASLMQTPRMQVEPGHGGLAYDRNTYGKPLRLMLGVV